ncbi:FGGY family carbohydrate kinase [Cohaesibacter celericrescens]|uniref:ATP:glycerol 3-phosphotransferase n=1 Tax=Cohaesibacter celericrescens TaxID=2067669 RepID=A0A2N5XU51_9HYPH|nr:glycerol kinase GlpK [Cohaesibacter celericrescens]PLW77987.1 carbohydrate kinase [Cohaesibacter celericrescens]
MTGLILSIDQGTSGTKAILFDRDGQPQAKGSVALASIFPQAGFVEQDPDDIYNNVIDAVRDCFEVFGSTPQISACGISNQRETFVLWDSEGKPLNNAVVWQCKRSSQVCERLKGTNLEADIRRKTGLIVDPYFSGSKVIWLKENNADIAARIEAGEAYFGTIDTWLVYRLTGGKSYATDVTNACRTLFFNLKDLCWDKDLLEQMGLSKLNLPSLNPSSCNVGETDIGGLLDQPIPITGLIGDSHAAAFGEGCHQSGQAKATLGTGSSILMNTGDTPAKPQNGMVSTICWAIEGRVDYALEGIIVSCGATIQWLRDQAALVSDAAQTEAMARAVPNNGGVYFIPAFSGLGAPYWKMDAKAMIAGLTFGSTKNHIARAALESVAFQIKDVINAMKEASGVELGMLNADGGMTKNQFVMQSLADLLGCSVQTIDFEDISALGAAYMAGLGAGVYADISELPSHNEGRSLRVPDLDAKDIVACHQTWQDIIHKVYC